MLFFLNLDGTVTRSDTDHVYQGQNKVANVELFTLISPAQAAIQVAFTLPNGLTTTYAPMSYVGAYSVDESNQKQVHRWKLAVPYNVTEVEGQVGVSFNVLLNDGTSGQTQETINQTTYTSSFLVEYSALPIPPTTATESELEQLLELLNLYYTQNASLAAKQPFVVGTVKTNTLGANQQASVAVEQSAVADGNGNYPTNFDFGIPQGTTFTPSVDDNGNISWSNDGGKANPVTKNIKGAQGQNGATPDIEMQVTVDANVGTPSVAVEKSGTAENPKFTLAFSNIKGVQGETGATGAPGADGVTPNISVSATIDNNEGTPSVDVTKGGTDANPSFKLDFHNLKGATGATGATGAPGADGNHITISEFNHKFISLETIEVGGTYRDVNDWFFILGTYTSDNKTYQQLAGCKVIEKGTTSSKARVMDILDLPLPKDGTDGKDGNATLLYDGALSASVTSVAKAQVTVPTGRSIQVDDILISTLGSTFGAMAQVVAVDDTTAVVDFIGTLQGGSGVSDYNELANKPIINQDLTADGFTPVAGTYYRHTGTGGGSAYTTGAIYYYNGSEYKAITGGSAGTTNYNELENIPVINQDLSASGFTPVANTYYKHTGATTDTFTQGIIYLYDTAYHKLGESGGGISDVQVNGTSVVTDGVANIPTVSESNSGVVSNIVQDNKQTHIIIGEYTSGYISPVNQSVGLSLGKDNSDKDFAFYRSGQGNIIYSSYQHNPLHIYASAGDSINAQHIGLYKTEIRRYSNRTSYAGSELPTYSGTLLSTPYSWSSGTSGSVTLTERGTYQFYTGSATKTNYTLLYVELGKESIAYAGKNMQLEIDTNNVVHVYDMSQVEPVEVTVTLNYRRIGL